MLQDGIEVPYGMNRVTADTFDDLSMERLRLRRSEKWSAYPADVLPAFVAEMDFDLAVPIRDALQRAIELGDAGYAGIDELAPAFAHFTLERFDWKIEERRVFAVPDIMSGVTESILLFTRPADRIVINPPVYPPFFEAIRLAGREIDEVPLIEEEQRGWMLDFEALERAFAAGARAFLLCNPHNPVGRAWNVEELERVASLAGQYDVAVISDEVHAPLTMPGIRHVPYLRVANGEASTSVLSASKAWNIAGLKCAVVVAGSDGVRAALREQLRGKVTEIRDRVGHLGIIGNIAAFREGGAWLDELRAHLDRNRELLAVLLREHIPGTRYRMPQAGYLAWIDCRQLGLGDDLAGRFLARGRVALESGYKFGAPGKGYVRVNMGTSSAILREIVARMKAAL